MYIHVNQGMSAIVVFMSVSHFTLTKAMFRLHFRTMSGAKNSAGTELCKVPIHIALVNHISTASTVH